MKQYIDKTALVAEIEDWRDKIVKGIFDIPLTGSDRAYATFEYEILGKIKDFIDTLEVKEVEEEAVSNDLDYIKKELDEVVSNRNHFDYRGLIEKELAIAVTEEDNPYKS